MDRKNITIREDQTEWIEEQGLNLSQFVQDRLDEERGPSEEELEAAYAENADRAREISSEWQYASDEANERLGEPAEIDRDRSE